MAQALLLIGVSIFGALGTVNLLYTFFSNKFDPYEAQTKISMMNTSPRLTKENHSIGVIFYSVIYLALSFEHFLVVSNSIWLSILPILFAASYLYLTYRYWFKVPMIGILLALICFVASAGLIYL